MPMDGFRVLDSLRGIDGKKLGEILNLSKVRGANLIELRHHSVFMHYCDHHYRLNQAVQPISSHCNAHSATAKHKSHLHLF